MGTLVFLRQAYYQTQTWDMGIFDQTFWNTVHGRVMQNSIEQIPNHLGVHFAPILFFLVPGYVLFPSPYYLLIIQTLALVLGAIPVYILAKTFLSSNRDALIVAGGYLLYPSLHAVNWFDFHDVTLFIPLFLTALTFFFSGKLWWTVMFLVLSCMTQESAPLVVAAFGVFVAVLPKDLQIFVTRRHVLFGACVFFASLAYFIVVIYVLMPALGGGLLRIDRYAHLGSSVGEIVARSIHDPGLFIRTVVIKEKMLYIVRLLLPLAFLPVLSWRAGILVVPGLLQNMLTQYAPQFSGKYQYDSILVPGLILASILGLRFLRLHILNNLKVVMWTLLACLTVSFFALSPARPSSAMMQQFSSAVFFKDLDRAVDAIPDDVSVAASTFVVPHVSQREQIQLFGQESTMADVALIVEGDSFGFESEDAFYTHIAWYTEHPDYRVVPFGAHVLIVVRKDISLALSDAD